MRNFVKILKNCRNFSSNSAKEIKYKRVPIFAVEPMDAKHVVQGLEKLKKKQQHFQKNDGLPVFLKGGPFDRILFYTTMILAILGVTNTFAFIYGKAFPIKNAPEGEEPAID